MRNPVIGDVALTKSGIKSAIGHGLGPEKAMAFAAVVQVIKRGEIVRVNENWKGRGWDTFIIAAPIRVARGEYEGDYLCAAIVKRASRAQQYDLHEVLMEIKI